MDKPKSEKDVIKSLEENPKPSLPDKNTTINIPPSVKHPAVVELMARIEALEDENSITTERSAEDWKRMHHRLYTINQDLESENKRLKAMLTPEKQKQREILVEMLNEPESQEELWGHFLSIMADHHFNPRPGSSSTIVKIVEELKTKFTITRK